MKRTEFLKEQTISASNKRKRTPIPNFSLAEESCSLAERKALTLKKIFDEMPIFIGERELIAGTRTFLSPNKGNEDGHDVFDYNVFTCIPYVNESDISKFGCDESYSNKTHYTPDFSIILEKGIDGIIRDAESRKNDTSLRRFNIEFLSSVIIAYTGLKSLILRYADEALRLTGASEKETKSELTEIARICRKISSEPAQTFHEAVQLLWFTHLGAMIESFEFINYGRLDVILGKYLKDTPRDYAQQLIECLLLKMYDQTDLNCKYPGKYTAQLVVTLGGVLPNGENAVNEVTMMFLEAVDKIRLPDPEFNLRINSKNPPEFLDKASELTISGCNFISYYNDDLFIRSLNLAGIPLEYARDYGFDLCQDINIPGKGDFFFAFTLSLAHSLMRFLKSNRKFPDFRQMFDAFKGYISANIEQGMETHNLAQQHCSLYVTGNHEEYFNGIKERGLPTNVSGKSPMAPLPLLSGLYHGTLENALDVVFEPYPLTEKGVWFGTSVEAINSLSAIKKTVFDDKVLSLDEIYSACETDFDGRCGEIIKGMLCKCPKWGNDDDYVDSIAVELLDFCLSECKKYKTFYGGQLLGGIHMPHPVLYGKELMATPEGRNAFTPVAVTLSPENGTMKKGPTAVLKSASKINPELVQWNYCVMVNYFSSIFRDKKGKDTFKALLKGYFDMGGLQHQPNVADINQLKKAQKNPEKYKDLVVRLWGVSANFVDLTKELQDEIIQRFQ